MDSQSISFEAPDPGGKVEGKRNKKLLIIEILYDKNLIENRSRSPITGADGESIIGNSVFIGYYFTKLEVTPQFCKAGSESASGSGSAKNECESTALPRIGRVAIKDKSYRGCCCCFPDG